jgi:gas vesicle protein
MTHHPRQSDSSGLSDFLFGLFLGLLGGVVLGILYAPKSGEATRGNVWRVTRTVSGRVRDDFRNPYGKTRRFIDKTRYNLESRIERVNTAIQAGRMADAKRRERNAAAADDFDPDAVV